MSPPRAPRGGRGGAEPQELIFLRKIMFGMWQADIEAICSLWQSKNRLRNGFLSQVQDALGVSEDATADQLPFFDALKRAYDEKKFPTVFNMAGPNKLNFASLKVVDAKKANSWHKMVLIHMDRVSLQPVSTPKGKAGDADAWPPRR